MLKNLQLGWGDVVAQHIKPLTAMWTLVVDLTTSLPIQLPDNAPAKAVKDGQSASDPVLIWDIQKNH